MAICDIGGVMGVYAGFSMITFVQILAFGGYILWVKKKKRKSEQKEQEKEETFIKKVTGKHSVGSCRVAPMSETKV